MTFRSFPKTGKPKYGNVRSLCALGHSHRSQLESSVCALLQRRVSEGELRDLTAEVRVLICGDQGHLCDSKQKIESIVDFRATVISTGEPLYIEAKGFEAPGWPLKRRLWIHNRTERLEIWRGSAKNPKLDEVIH